MFADVLKQSAAGLLLLCTGAKCNVTTAEHGLDNSSQRGNRFAGTKVMGKSARYELN